jgi:hypothetical protein
MLTNRRTQTPKTFCRVCAAAQPFGVARRDRMLTKSRHSDAEGVRTAHESTHRDAETPAIRSQAEGFGATTCCGLAVGDPALTTRRTETPKALAPLTRFVTIKQKAALAAFFPGMRPGC